MDTSNNAALPDNVETDLDGNIRIINGTVDRGAYESQVIVAPPCVADFNGDAEVDFDDLMMLLSSWGWCPGCSTDIDGSGTVEFDDLLELLSSWGGCPS